MALIWLYSESIWLALLPLALYPTVHLLSYTGTKVIPAFAPTADLPTPAPVANSSAPLGGCPNVQSSFSESIVTFVIRNYDNLMDVICKLEIMLWAMVLSVRCC